MLNSRPIVIALALSLVLAGAGAAAATDPAALATARRQLQAAVNRPDSTSLLGAHAAFAALQIADASSPELAYWIALTDWRAVPVLAPTHHDLAKSLCKEGIAACDRAIALRPKFADALALRASLLGMSFQFLGSAAGMSLGEEMAETFGRATSLEPKNPRVAFFVALSTLYKPAEVGGGPLKAKPMFARALALDAAAPPDSACAIAWGHDDLWLWAGQCDARLEDWKSAADRYHHALAANPENSWVRYVLLPEAEKKLASAGGAR